MANKRKKRTIINKKRVVLWKSAGILMLTAIFFLWSAMYRVERVPIPQTATATEQWRVGRIPSDGAAEVFSGIKQAESICYRYIEDCPLSKKTQREIFEVCAGANLSFELVMALIYQESGWDPKCVSDEGQSVGLMQVQEKWHRETMDKLGCNDLKDPVQNVRVGTELLRGYFREYKEPAWALMAYNGGQAYADRQVMKGNISVYAVCILERAARFEEENGL